LLHWAAEQQLAPKVQLLLVADSSAAGWMVDGGTPLHTAAKVGCTAAMRLLLAAAPETATACSASSYVPLHLAAQHVAPGGNPALVERGAPHSGGQHSDDQQFAATSGSRVRAHSGGAAAAGGRA
jgi:ankyrin repeat protein